MPYWLQFVLFAIISGLVQYIISYFKEKGKNLATKEDIGKITQEIESVKSSYSSSLELFKINLQKDFEHSKSIINYCNQIDTQLINLLIDCNNCIQEDIKDGFISTGDGEVLRSVKELSYFIEKYKGRYSSSIAANEIITYANRFKALEEVELEYYDYVSNFATLIHNTQSSIQDLLSFFLPKLQIKEPEN